MKFFAGFPELRNLVSHAHTPTRGHDSQEAIRHSENALRSTSSSLSKSSHVGSYGGRHVASRTVSALSSVLDKGILDPVSAPRSRRQRTKSLWRRNNARSSRPLRDSRPRSGKQTVDDPVYIRPPSRIGGHHAATFLLCQANIYSTYTCRSYAATVSIRACRRDLSRQYARGPPTRSSEVTAWTSRSRTPSQCCLQCHCLNIWHS
jgi:hypothetical protein